MSNWLAAAARSFAICALFPVWVLTALLSIPLIWITGADLRVAEWARDQVEGLVTELKERG